MEDIATEDVISYQHSSVITLPYRYPTGPYEPPLAEKNAVKKRLFVDDNDTRDKINPYHQDSSVRPLPYKPSSEDKDAVKKQLFPEDYQNTSHESEPDEFVNTTVKPEKPEKLEKLEKHEKHEKLETDSKNSDIVKKCKVHNSVNCINNHGFCKDCFKIKCHSNNCYNHGHIITLGLCITCFRKIRNRIYYRTCRT